MIEKNFYFFVLLSIGGWSIWRLTRDIGLHSPNVTLGLGRGKESVNTLFSRLDWINGYKNRREMIPRLVLISLILSFIILIVLFDRIPSGTTMAKTFLVVFTVLFSSLNYFEHHADRYEDSFREELLSLLKKKLKVKREEIFLNKLEKEDITKHLNFKL